MADPDTQAFCRQCQRWTLHHSARRAVPHLEYLAAVILCAALSSGALCLGLLLPPTAEQRASGESSTGELLFGPLFVGAAGTAAIVPLLWAAHVLIPPFWRPALICGICGQRSDRPTPAERAEKAPYWAEVRRLRAERRTERQIQRAGARVWRADRRRERRQRRSAAIDAAMARAFGAENDLVCQFFGSLIKGLLWLGPWAVIAGAGIAVWHFTR